MPFLFFFSDACIVCPTTVGVIALEMAQSFALLGSDVTVINRSSTLFQSKFGDTDAAQILQQQLEKVNRYVGR